METVFAITNCECGGISLGTVKVVDRYADCVRVDCYSLNSTPYSIFASEQDACPMVFLYKRIYRFFTDRYARRAKLAFF